MTRCTKSAPPHSGDATNLPIYVYEDTFFPFHVPPSGTEISLLPHSVMLTNFFHCRFLLPSLVPNPAHTHSHSRSRFSSFFAFFALIDLMATIYTWIENMARRRARVCLCAVCRLLWSWSGRHHDGWWGWSSLKKIKRKVEHSGCEQKRKRNEKKRKKRRTEARNSERRNKKLLAFPLTNLKNEFHYLIQRGCGSVLRWKCIHKHQQPRNTRFLCIIHFSCSGRGSVCAVCGRWHFVAMRPYILLCSVAQHGHISMCVSATAPSTEHIPYI